MGVSTDKTSLKEVLSIVYLTYIYRISNVYLPCLIKQRQITRDKALDSEYQSFENKIRKK